VALEASTAEPDHDAVLLPGLVNAHAHLDLAGSAPIPMGETFPDWLIGVGAARGAASDPRAAARQQAGALGARGVVAIGDIDANLGAATAGRLEAGVGGTSFLEIVGIPVESARARLIQTLAAMDRSGGPRVFALSPHAPYSIHESVLPEIARAARHRGLPMAMHLAESEEETRFLAQGDGPFTRLLDAIGRGSPFLRPPGLRPVAYAHAAGVLEGGALVIHGNDLDDDDIGLLARTGSTVVYCHGTHRHFDRPRHRLTDLLAAGVEVALGTDSDASNDGIDLLREMERLVADRPDVSPATVLRAGTLGGRRALRRQPDAALFAPGSPADGLLLGDVPDDAHAWDGDLAVHWALSGDARVVDTVHAGRSWRGDDRSAALLDTSPGRG
jgi:cytosine/adenosine deaminase-related metal-dependent hydrolase